MSDRPVRLRIVLPAEPLVDGDTALRPWRDADRPALVAACQDAEIARWTSVPAPYGDADARAYLRQRFDAAAAGLTAPFAIV
ncbi:MAG: GNAT family N-acetyltransferase, partial [Solirubrobacteraceae bacterium]